MHHGNHYARQTIYEIVAFHAIDTIWVLLNLPIEILIIMAMTKNRCTKRLSACQLPFDSLIMKSLQIPHPSRVLEKLRAGRKATCFKFNLGSYRAVEMAALAGFDCVWLCQEHVPTDSAILDAQILAAKAHCTDSLVRVKKGCYSDYILPLEADATGIMIPHLMNLEEAHEIVQQTRFAPIGRRPVDGGNADALFGSMNFTEYLRFANANRMLIVQIEDPEPLPQLDKICQVKGIDMLFFGPGDFSQAIGHPGEFGHPEVARTRRLVLETAHKYGKFAGTVCVPSVAECFAEGFDFVNCGSDVGALNESLGKALSMADNVLENK